MSYLGLSSVGVNAPLFQMSDQVMIALCIGIGFVDAIVDVLGSHSSTGCFWRWLTGGGL